MNKKLKRSFLAAGIVVGVCALVWGGLTLLRNGSRSAVKVYPVTGISMTDYWGDTTETSGTVTMDKLQKVFLSQTQTSAQVYVTEGQTVKKGDRLLSYDSTLTELDVERARIALERLRLQQENTRKELQRLQLAVYGGQSHGLTAAAEPVRQRHGRGAAAGAGGDAVQHCLLLPGHIGHMRHLADLKMKTVFRL